MATKKSADWKFFVCVVAGWAIFLFVGSAVARESGLALKGTPGIILVIIEGVAGGLIGSYVYTAFFRGKNSS
jgi:hypothetical protein